MSKKTLSIKLDQSELWAVYICIHNLPVTPKENFYEKKIKQEMIEVRDKLHNIGKREYKWV